MSSISNSTINTPKPITVFVVDDEQVLATSLAMILKIQAGFDAQSFCYPREALAAARIQQPSLLITDVVMPEMTGIELAIEVQKECPACKVLLFSGQAATVDLLNTANGDGHHFELISKPIHPKDLLTKVRDNLK